MTDIEILVAELSTDPLGSGYSTMDFNTMKSSLLNPVRSVVNYFSGQDLKAQIDPGDLAALPPERLSLILEVSKSVGLDLNTGTVDRAFAESAFSGMTNTLANIASNIAPNTNKLVGRAEEIGVPDLSDGKLIEARRISGVGV